MEHKTPRLQPLASHSVRAASPIYYTVDQRQLSQPPTAITDSPSRLGQSTCSVDSQTLHPPSHLNALYGTNLGVFDYVNVNVFGWLLSKAAALSGTRTIGHRTM